MSRRPLTQALHDPLGPFQRRPLRRAQKTEHPTPPCVFTPYERFVDQAAMDAHNNSQVVARFFGIAKSLLDGDVVLVTASEISARS
jgi:quinol monooxygenase YgiN